MVDGLTLEPSALRKILDVLVKDESLWCLVLQPDGKKVRKVAAGKDDEVLETYCNFAVQRVAKAFGLIDLDGLNATQIYEHLAAGNGWMKVPGEQAADFAQRGGLAIAAMHVQFHGHGHVAALYPAPMGESASLGRTVPQVANVGQHNGVKRSSEAFPPKFGEAEYFEFVG